jgi:hypothetical protein
MAAYYTIPLTPEPQSFGIALGGREYRLTVRWFETPEGGWHLDMEEPDGEAPLIMGIPLVTGCDLLEQYAYMGFGGELRVDSALPATLENLGTDVELVFFVEDEHEPGQ